MNCTPPSAWDDPRVLSLSHAQHRQWCHLVALAAQGRAWGVIPAIPGCGLARALRTQAHHLERVLILLAGMGLVERRADGSLWLTLFAQEHDIASTGASAAEMPAKPINPSTARSQKHRSKLRAESAAPAREATQKSVPKSVAGSVASFTHVSKNVLVQRSPESEIALQSSSSEYVQDNHRPHAQTTPNAGPPPSFPNNHGAPKLHEEITKQQRSQAVDAVIKATGDNRANRGAWVQLWNKCHETEQMALWDEAFASLVAELRGGKRPIINKAAWLQRTLRNMLCNAGVPLPTAAEVRLAIASGEGPAEVRRLLAASLATADAAKEQAVA